MTRSAAALVVSLTLLMAGCATQPNAKKDPRDPLERFNRVSYKVTDAVDRAALKPAAKAYKAVTPQFVETGVSNFFSNLAQPTNIVNDLLQAKFKPALNDTGRFLLNTTVGCRRPVRPGLQGRARPQQRRLRADPRQVGRAGGGLRMGAAVGALHRA